MGNITTYNWDPNSALAEHRRRPGKLTTFSYVTLLENKISSLTSITQPLGGIFTYTYNSNDQVSSLTDQLGNVTTLLWNSSGLRSAAIDALGNRTSYSYNSMGQLASVQNPLGQLVTLVYNSLGQQIALINSLGNRVELYLQRQRDRADRAEPAGGDRDVLERPGQPADELYRSAW